jgi:hypothetical protein
MYMIKPSHLLLLLMSNYVLSSGLEITPKETCPLIIPGVVYYGNHVDKVHANTTEACCDKCKEVPDCQGFHLEPPNICWRQYFLTNRAAVSMDRYQGFVKRTTNVDGCIQLPPYMVYGSNVLYTVTVASLDECCSNCLDDPECKGWVADLTHNGQFKCWIKYATLSRSKRNTPVPVAFAGIAVRRSRPRGCAVRLRGILYAYNNIDHKIVADIDECCNHCLEHRECIAFSWSHETSMCYRKYALTDRKVASGFTTGFADRG